MSLDGFVDQAGYLNEHSHHVKGLSRKAGRNQYEWKTNFLNRERYSLFDVD